MNKAARREEHFTEEELKKTRKRKDLRYSEPCVDCGEEAEGRQTDTQLRCGDCGYKFRQTHPPIIQSSRLSISLL